MRPCFFRWKIPAAQRASVPVIADERGVLGVYGIGVNLDRVPQQLPATRIHVEIINSSESCKEK